MHKWPEPDLGKAVPIGDKASGAAAGAPGVGLSSGTLSVAAAGALRHVVAVSYLGNDSSLSSDLIGSWSALHGAGLSVKFGPVAHRGTRR